MPDAGAEKPATEVTVVNPASWAGRSLELAQLLRIMAAREQGARVIADPTGRPADPERLLVITDPEFWASRPLELEEVVAGRSREEVTGSHRSAGATTDSETRLTLTVEEAAAALGISRASAYEAVHRKQIPSIRIGRRLLVPRVALSRLLDVDVSEPEEA